MRRHALKALLGVTTLGDHLDIGVEDLYRLLAPRSRGSVRRNRSKAVRSVIRVPASFASR